MNENIDLTKILKNCPKGWRFWSPLFGEVEFNRIKYGYISVITKYKNYEPFNTDATITIEDVKSAEIMLYPSKDQRDWSKFTAPWDKKEKFDPKTLQPFDRVLCQHDNYSIWQCNLFSHIHADYKNLDYPVHCMSNTFMYCIPYNDDTKHLIGTTDEAPEYYRYWEE